ncbi:MAG: flavoprotein [Gemmatales bacterium]|nr:phosphopantothenoylcysteine decarboxylase [Gemmatales bacterium]MCS7160035.1 phosphopantothenoylcysteine decarboxylase [Gemmatales bacterium]MDW8175234.1 flavoprotein [Gemmatales bacterium]MDW8223900.1 flavoprotein [Gemmatales bacterium]
MAKVLLGVTGSVAAIRTPLLYESLAQGGHDVRVVLTESAEYFFDARALATEAVFRDADEWPRRRHGERYQRDDPVLHIELRRWADLLLVAPLDAHTLAKFALGLCDNLLSCIYRAWERDRPIVLAPAMNTTMWDHPATARHLRQLFIDHSTFLSEPLSMPAEASALCELVNQHCPKLRVLTPVVKRLACGDEGMGAMVEVNTIVAAVEAALAS